MIEVTEGRRRPAAIIVKPGRSEPKVSLVCFHHAGGNALLNLSWRSWLPEDTTLYCVQLNRTGINSVDPSERVAYIKRVLLVTTKIWESEHIIMFGHSLGGLLAYTIAAEILHETNHVINQIIASAICPNINGLTSSPRSGSDAGYFELLYDLIYLGGVPKELASDKELLDEAVSDYREDLALLEYLESKKPPRVNSHLRYFFPQHEGIEKNAAEAAWESWSGNSPIISLFDGGHFYLSRNHEVIKSALLERIASCNLDPYE
jgi:medium-chain acyl-[acyl-carrier-protein] hydrolase